MSSVKATQKLSLTPFVRSCSGTGQLYEARKELEIRHDALKETNFSRLEKPLATGQVRTKFINEFAIETVL